MTEELKPLSRKHQRVLDEYLVCFNQWRAYKKVFPKVTDESARALSSKLFADVNFLGNLTKRLNEAHMSADEALKLQSDIARGDMAQLMDVYSTGFNLDMAKAKELGLTRLIKKVKQKTTTHIAKSESDEDREVVELEIELYDAQAAIRDVLKIHGKFVERRELTGKDGEALIPKEDNDTRSEILRKLDSIAAATGAGGVSKPTDGEGN